MVKLEIINHNHVKMTRCTGQQNQSTIAGLFIKSPPWAIQTVSEQALEYVFSYIAFKEILYTDMSCSMPSPVASKTMA